MVFRDKARDGTTRLTGGPIVAPEAPVTSVNGDIGDVVLDAIAIPNAPAGSISATDVQNALNELDTEKATVTKTINVQTGTNYTLVLADNGKFVTMNNAAASTFTVPLNSSQPFPIGACVEGAQLGAGLVTITPTGGVTINAAPGLKSGGQYSVWGLLKIGTDTWLAYGRLAA